MSIPSVLGWEAIHAHYDSSTYQSALALLRPDDVVLDIGAGDLYFSKQIAQTVNKVYAVELNESVLGTGLTTGDPLPDNLIPICADARTFDFPTDVTVGVLLMRHCTCFYLYFEKLCLSGAQRFVTNARWRMNIEEIDLLATRNSFTDLELGWYACSCGATGFKVGPAEQWSEEMDRVTHEVFACPQCEQCKETSQFNSLEMQ
jgi:hypothetical protein